MRLRSWVIVILGAVLTSLAEATLFSLFPYPLNGFRPVLDAIVIMIVLNRSKAAIAVAAISGVVIDLFTVGPSSFAIGRLLIIALIIELLYRTIFTNRSIYATLALITIARIIELAWYLLTSLLGAQRPPFFLPLLWDIGVISIVFIVIATFTRRFVISGSSYSDKYYGG